MQEAITALQSQQVPVPGSSSLSCKGRNLLQPNPALILPQKPVSNRERMLQVSGPQSPYLSC